MPALFCARTPADQVDYANERFIACKSVGVTAGGRKFEMGDELPAGVLPPRAMREIYDTPLRLVETMDYALADPELLAVMMARPLVVTDEPEDDDEEKDTDGDVASLPAAAAARTPTPRAGSKASARTRR